MLRGHCFMAGARRGGCRARPHARPRRPPAGDRAV